MNPFGARALCAALALPACLALAAWSVIREVPGAKRAAAVASPRSVEQVAVPAPRGVDTAPEQALAVLTPDGSALQREESPEQVDPLSRSERDAEPDLDPMSAENSELSRADLFGRGQDPAALAHAVAQLELLDTTLAAAPADLEWARSAEQVLRDSYQALGA